MHRQLKISRRTSIEYATSMNLLSTILGWLVFFCIQPFLPYPLKLQIISFIFFNRFTNSQLPFINAFVIMLGIGLFFASFLIKVKGLDILQFLVSEPDNNQLSLEPESRKSKNAHSLVKQEHLQKSSTQAEVILLANACSHSAILMILFLRSIEINF
ncbi:MAG: hypothetical protein KME08_05120 [Aphanothece sp. CMT-3BRIN-NPC111]|nr:hypothetical protein [Aphanothece sp. CMT-3BRIN-NPC111]